MSSLPSIAPRLVFHAADIEDTIADLAEEHTALQAELRALVCELEATAPAPRDWDLDDAGALMRAATTSVEELCGARRDAALAGLDAEVAKGEQAAAERVAAAEREAAHHLAVVRSDVADHLVGQFGEEEPVAASPRPERPPGGLHELDEPVPGEKTPIEGAMPATPPGVAVLEEAAEAKAWGDPEPETDRFRSFWCEQDEAVSVRAAIAAPLIAIAPMALALLVIVLVLVLVV